MNLSETGVVRFLKRMQSPFKQAVHFSAMWYHLRCIICGHSIKGVFHKAEKRCAAQEKYPILCCLVLYDYISNDSQADILDLCVCLRTHTYALTSILIDISPTLLFWNTIPMCDCRKALTFHVKQW